jgi:DNA-binding response OmpR family regulator
LLPQRQVLQLYITRKILVSVSESRILIADPDPDILRSLQIYFENGGYVVQVVSSASEVVAAARPSQPSAILISDAFTDKDAYQVCRDLLADMLTGHIPVIVLLNLNERQARLQALETGVNDVVAKPFDIEELRLRVEAAIRLATMRAEA